eukprot:6214406-Pleurochrysis_carterae.AAC.4
MCVRRLKIARRQRAAACPAAPSARARAGAPGRAATARAAFLRLALAGEMGKLHRRATTR